MHYSYLKAVNVTLVMILTRTLQSMSHKLPQRRKSSKNIISTPEVAGALDRVNLPDRGAMIVVSSVVKALGHHLYDLALSCCTIRRLRKTTRKLMTETDKNSFSVDCLLLLHWDGKLQPDIATTKETVGRIAVIVTGDGIEKLVTIPKIERGTGNEQATACLTVLDE